MAADGLEQAIWDIWLFGTSEQMSLAEEFATDFTAHGTADTEPPLRELRVALRHELLLGPPPDRRQWLRVQISEEARTGDVDRVRS